MEKRSELLEAAETQPNDTPADEAYRSKVAGNVRPSVIESLKRSMEKHAPTWEELAKH
jgi:hypothetical protein